MAEIQFSGVVWNIVAHPDRPLLLVESRDEKKKQAAFSVLDVNSGDFLWKEEVFEEPWWISLTEAVNDIVLLTVFREGENPDHKTLLACDLTTRTLLWWRNNFSMSDVNSSSVSGTDAAQGMKKITLDLRTGQEVSGHQVLPLARNFPVTKPFQYLEGSRHFDTVSAFVAARSDVRPVSMIEYAEYGPFVVISCYGQQDGLANFLLLFRNDGRPVFVETIGENLKGVGMDTFFIFSGYLTFVKKRSSLVMCKLL